MYTHPTPIKYKQWECKLHISHFTSDPHIPALFLNDFNTGEPIVRGSTNITGGYLEPGHTVLNAHDETADLLPTLIEAGIVSEPVDWVLSGYVKFPVCKLLVGDPADF